MGFIGGGRFLGNFVGKKIIEFLTARSGHPPKLFMLLSLLYMRLNLLSSRSRHSDEDCAPVTDRRGLIQPVGTEEGEATAATQRICDRTSRDL